MGRFWILMPLLLGMLAAAQPAEARSRQDSPASQGADETDLVEHGHYVNAAGDTVHSPAHTRDGAVPPGASARCRDGSYSFSRHRRGTCSGHGGVAGWM